MLKRNLKQWMSVLILISFTFVTQSVFAEDVVVDEINVRHEKQELDVEVPLESNVSDALSPSPFEVMVENDDETIVATSLEEANFYQVTNEEVKENFGLLVDSIIQPSPVQEGVIIEDNNVYLYHSGTKQCDTVYTNGNAKFYFETSGVLSRQKWSYSNKTATWYYSDANGEIIKEAALAHYVERGKQLYDIVVNINQDRYYYEPHYWGGVQSRNKWAYGVQDGLWYYTDTTGRIRKEANDKYYRHDGVQQSDTVLDINGTRYYYEPQHWGSVQSRNKWAYGVKDATWYYTDATGRIRKEANRHYYKHDGVQQSDTVLDINGTRYYYEPQHWGSVQSRNKWAYGVKDATWYYTDTAGRIRKEANRHYYKHDGVQQSDTVLDINGTRYYCEPQQWGGVQARNKWSYGVKDATWYYTDATGRIRQEANRTYYKHDGVQQSDTVLDINGTRYYYEPQQWGGVQARNKWAYGVKDATWYYTDATGRIRKEANRHYYKHDGVQQSDTVLDINGTHYYYEPAAWGSIQARSKWSYGVKDATWYETNSQGHIIQRSKISPFVREPKKETVTEIRKEVVPFGTDNLDDPQLDKGKVRIEAGHLGEDTLTYEITKVDGVVTQTRLVSRQRTKAPVNKKVYTGTKDVITERTYTRDEVIPIPTEVEGLQDEHLPVGQTRNEAGVAGLERVTYRVVTTNGVESAPEVVMRQVLKSAVAPKLYTGTKLLITPEEIVPPADKPKAKRPTLTFRSINTNPMLKQATLSYDLLDEDSTFVNAVSKLIHANQDIEQMSLSKAREVSFSNLSFDTPYQVQTTIMYQLDGEVINEVVHTSNLFELALKKIELKAVESVSLQLPINANLQNQRLVQIKLKGLNEILAPVTEMEEVTFNHQEVYRIKVELPELVQYDTKTKTYSSNHVFLLGKDGIFLNKETNVDYSQLPRYNANRETAYHNIAKLLPFYDRDTIVKYGNKISASHEWMAKPIQVAIPMVNETFSLDLAQDKANIQQLFVRYEDGTTSKYRIAFNQDFVEGLIAEYSIDDTDLIYTPHQWQRNNHTKLNEVISAMQSISYYDTPVWRALGGKGKTNYESMDLLYLKESFKDVQTQLPTIIPQLLANTYLTQNTDLSEYVESNKEKILIGLAYINKWYNVNFRDISMKDLVLYRQDFFGKSTNQLDWVIQVGGRSYERLRPNETPETYKHILAKQTGYATIPAFITALREQFVPDMSDNDWFHQASKAYIVETPAKTANAQFRVYDKLQRESLVNTILPLLTLSQETVYVIPTMSTIAFGDFATYVDLSLKDSNPIKYQQDINSFKAIIQKEAKNHTAHFDMWYRIALPNVRERLVNNAIPVWDSFAQHQTNKWSERQGDNTTLAVREFFGPTGHWHARSTTADAVADGYAVWFIGNRLLRQGASIGGSIFTHEMVHNFEDTIYLGGHGRREGFGQESYAEGLFQSVRDRTRGSIGMNLYTIMDANEQRHLTHFNKSPERFQNANDWKTYIHGLLDVMYVLDYAEAMSLAKLPTHMKQLVLKKMTLVKDRDTNHATDFVTDYSGQEWSNNKFDKIEDFIENQAVVTRHHYQGAIITGGEHANRNTYTSIPLFSPMYGLLENDKGGSGGYTFRRTAFELLAHKGYEAGMIPYISDKLSAKARAEGQDLSDSYIVREIFGKEFSNLTEFKKAMFQERIQKLPTLRTVTIDSKVKNNAQVDSYQALQTLMDTAVRNDLNEMLRTGKQPSGWVHNLKEKLLQAYLNLTDEFRTSIFDEVNN